MGRYITKRAWVSKCRYCGKDIFYWESVAGHKVIFNYPIYDRLQKHICDQYYQQMQQKFIPRIPKYIRPEPERKNPLEVDEFKIYSCPVCSKPFKSKNILNDHIKTLKKLDENHRIFFDKVLDMINETFEESKTQEEHQENSPINIKNKNNPMDINAETYQTDQNIKMKTDFGKVVFRNNKKKITNI